VARKGRSGDNGGMTIADGIEIPAKELAEIWRKFCLNYTDYDQNSNSSN
jgi:hypothetical protein